MAQGRLRRLVTRRRVKWAGVCATPIFTLLIACTYFAHLSFGRTNPTTNWHHMILVQNGAVSVSGSDWFADLSAYPPRLPYGWRVGINYQRSFAALPTARWGKDGYRFLIPLWIPLLLIAAPTAGLWRTDRRAKPWQCPKCRYDLRGLDGGVCPVCGANGVRLRVLHSCSESSVVEPGEGQMRNVG